MTKGVSDAAQRVADSLLDCRLCGHSRVFHMEGPRYLVNVEFAERRTPTGRAVNIQGCYAHATVVSAFTFRAEVRQGWAGIADTVCACGLAPSQIS